VKNNQRRSGSIGRSTPAVAASSRNQIPAAQITRSVGIVPGRRLDTDDAPAALDRASRVCLHGQLGRDVAGCRTEGASEYVLDGELGKEGVTGSKPSEDFELCPAQPMVPSGTLSVASQ
jgi:hypothetical protein